jgi:ferredoxin
MRKLEAQGQPSVVHYLTYFDSRRYDNDPREHTSSAPTLDHSETAARRMSLWLIPPAGASAGSLTGGTEVVKLTAMRVVVDLNRCHGYGQCVFLAPSVFELHGEEALMYDPGPEEAQRLPVVRAAAACPVRAIRFDSPDKPQ